MVHESLCLSVFREGSTFHQAWKYRPLSHPRCPHSLCITPYPFSPNPHSQGKHIRVPTRVQSGQHWAAGWQAASGSLEAQLSGG